jgi:hypothetical protein
VDNHGEFKTESVKLVEEKDEKPSIKIGHFKATFDAFSLVEGPGAIVFAYSGVGKSTGALLQWKIVLSDRRQVEFDDGDELLEWPATSHFWEKWVGDQYFRQIELSRRHLLYLANYVARTKKVVLVAPNIDGLEKYISEVRTICPNLYFYDPGYDQVKHNLQKRASLVQPTEVKRETYDNFVSKLYSLGLKEAQMIIQLPINISTDLGSKISQDLWTPAGPRFRMMRKVNSTFNIYMIRFVQSMMRRSSLQTVSIGGTLLSHLMSIPANQRITVVDISDVALSASRRTYANSQKANDGRYTHKSEVSFVRAKISNFLHSCSGINILDLFNTGNYLTSSDNSLESFVSAIDGAMSDDGVAFISGYTPPISSSFELQHGDITLMRTNFRLRDTLVFENEMTLSGKSNVEFIFRIEALKERLIAKGFHVMKFKNYCLPNSFYSRYYSTLLVSKTPFLFGIEQLIRSYVTYYTE